MNLFLKTLWAVIGDPIAQVGLMALIIALSIKALAKVAPMSWEEIEEAISMEIPILYYVSMRIGIEKPTDLRETKVVRTIGGTMVASLKQMESQGLPAVDVRNGRALRAIYGAYKQRLVFWFSDAFLPCVMVALTVGIGVMLMAPTTNPPEESQTVSVQETHDPVHETDAPRLVDDAARQGTMTIKGPSWALFSTGLLVFATTLCMLKADKVSKRIKRAVDGSSAVAAREDLRDGAEGVIVEDVYLGHRRTGA